VTVSIWKFKIIVLVSKWIEYWSNYSIWFEISNIREWWLNVSDVLVLVVVVKHRTGEGGLVWPNVVDSGPESQTRVAQCHSSYRRSRRIQLEVIPGDEPVRSHAGEVSADAHPHADRRWSRLPDTVRSVLELCRSRGAEGRSACWDRLRRGCAFIRCADYVQVFHHMFSTDCF